MRMAPRCATPPCLVPLWVAAVQGLRCSQGCMLTWHWLWMLRGSFGCGVDIPICDDEIDSDCYFCLSTRQPTCLRYLQRAVGSFASEPPSVPYPWRALPQRLIRPHWPWPPPTLICCCSAARHWACLLVCMSTSLTVDCGFDCGLWPCSVMIHCEHSINAQICMCAYMLLLSTNPAEQIPPRTSSASSSLRTSSQCVGAPLGAPCWQPAAARACTGLVRGRWPQQVYCHSSLKTCPAWQRFGMTYACSG